MLDGQLINREGSYQGEKTNAFLPPVKILIHYSIHIPSGVGLEKSEGK